ncbi:methyltransferase [Streptomyces aurantiacus]|uniref:Methyltransferase n=1 Tax=Streptomyces aurantiacus TaxID=47760 RepID=A0A7G1P0J4_9ACTN|nr:methyltransferase [Streptomyces aurantiacus]
MNPRPRRERGPSGARPTVRLLTGDAVEVLRTLPTGSADCVVTSPPYWRLRDYGTGSWTGGSPACPHPDATDPAGPPASVSAPRSCTRCGAAWTDEQYGLEPTPLAYVQHLRQVFAQLYRVLAPAGTAWLNLGDSYSTNSDGYWCSRPGQYRQPRYRPRADVSPKNLIGMPWRVAQALQADGWILRNAIIWHKPNAAPFPSRDRLTCRYEVLFLLVKQQKYFFNLDPICQSYTGDRSLSRGAHRRGNAPHTARGTRLPSSRTQTASPSLPGRDPGDVWTIPVIPGQHQLHPAAFPIDIPLRCIAAGCPPHGSVLDPFSGTGTTGQAAIHLNHPYTGIDLNPAFHRHALTRLNDVVPGIGDVADHSTGPRTEVA